MMNCIDRWRGDGTGVLRDLGSLGAGALGMTGQFNGEPPSDRSYGAETGKTLGAQIQNLPTAYGAEAQYQPMYAQLGLQNLGGILGGQGTDTSGGLLALLTGQVAPQLRAAQSADVASEANDAANTARMTNPGGASLIDTLLGQSQQALDNGLSAGELRDVQQGIRGAQAARGVGYGPADTTDEVFGVGMAGRQLRQQNMANALSAVGGSQSFYGNPFQLVMRGGGVGTNAATQGLSLADRLMGNGPRLTNPESNYASSLYGGNYQGQLAMNLQNAKDMIEYVKMNAQGGDSLSGMGGASMMNGGGGGGGGGFGLVN